MQVEIQQLDTIRVVALEHQGAYHQIGSTFDKVLALVKSLGIPMNETIGIFYDDPGSKPEADLRSEACLVVASDFEGEVTPLRVLDIPAGEYAVALVQGSYSGLPAAWGRVCGEGLTALGRRMSDGLCFERYLNDCSEVAESELLTAIVVPLEPA